MILQKEYEFTVTTADVTWTIAIPWSAKVALSSRAFSIDANGEIDAKMGEAIDIVLSECVKDWQGVTDEQGNAIPFSVENAQHLPFDLLVELTGKVLNRVFGGGQGN